MLNRKRPEIKTETIEVATLQEALMWFYGNKTGLANHIGMERGTIRKKIRTGEHKTNLLIVRRDGDKVIGFEMINRYRERE